jgi:hypothetical protein
VASRANHSPSLADFQIVKPDDVTPAEQP